MINKKMYEARQDESNKFANAVRMMISLFTNLVLNQINSDLHQIQEVSKI